ncbi:Protein of unknown function [Gryllus bimaculatus]|nr:Protein of unknown function [Gryllus bimaculatus]
MPLNMTAATPAGRCRRKPKRSGAWHASIGGAALSPWRRRRRRRRRRRALGAARGHAPGARANGVPGRGKRCSRPPRARAAAPAAAAAATCRRAGAVRSAAPACSLESGAAGAVPQ